MRPKIDFEVGEPITLTLRYAQGLEIESKYYERWPGDVTQYVFSAVEGVFYLPDLAGSLLNARLRASDYEAGETLTITKTFAHSPVSSRPVTEYIPFVCRGTE